MICFLHSLVSLHMLTGPPKIPKRQTGGRIGKENVFCCVSINPERYVGVHSFE